MKHIFKILSVLFVTAIILTPTVVAETIIIESDSMSHGSEPTDEALDTGDMIQVVNVASRDDITTYVEGTINNYKMFGDYGDVIIYYRNGNKKDYHVIHRAVVWIEYNASGSNAGHNLGDLGSFDVPSMGLYDVTSVTIPDYGYKKENLTMNLLNILNNFNENAISPHSGYLTKGDRNTICDQFALVDSNNQLVRPVKLEWIKGKADVLFNSNVIIIFVSIIILIVIVVLIIVIYKKIKNRKEQERFD